MEEEEAGDSSAAGPGEAAAEDIINKSSESPAEAAAGDIIDKSLESPAEAAAEDIIKKSSESPAEVVAEDMVAESSKSPAESAAENVVGRATSDTTSYKPENIVNLIIDKAVGDREKVEGIVEGLTDDAMKTPEEIIRELIDQMIPGAPGRLRPTVEYAEKLVDSMIPDMDNKEYFAKLLLDAVGVSKGEWEPELTCTTDEERQAREVAAVLGLSKSEEDLAEQERLDREMRKMLLGVIPEEEEEGEWEEKEEVFDRMKWVERYTNLCTEKYLLKKQYIILQRRVFDYCKKKNLDSVYFQDSAPDEELEARFNKVLMTYKEFKDEEAESRESMIKELNHLTKEKNETEEWMNKAINDLIEREREIGTGLIFEKTAKPLHDKVLERFLTRQQKKVREVQEIRLRYIKLRNKVAIKEEALNALESIGEGLHLNDYEQLRMENQSFADKIEERDEELAKLRKKATSAIQILAHIREKAKETAATIEDTYDNMAFVEIQRSNAREYNANLKKTRDKLREQANQERIDAGMLVLPSLLRDLDTTLEANQYMRVQVQNMRNTYHMQGSKLKTLRATLRNTIRSSSMFQRSVHRPMGSMQETTYRDLMRHRIKSMPRKIIPQVVEDPELEDEEDIMSDQSPQITDSRPSFFPRKTGIKSEYMETQSAGRQYPDVDRP